MINGAQSLNPGKFVELLEIDLTSAPNKPNGWTSIIRLSTSAVGFNQGPSLGGALFTPASFQVTGITQDAGGKIPEPTLKIQVPEQAPGNLMDFLIKGGDPRGAIVRRIIINEQHLDHKTPNNSPSVRIEQKFFINQMAELYRHQLTFKLATTMGLDALNDKINRTLSSNQCNKKYRVWNIVDQRFKYVPVEDGGCEWGQAGEQSNFSYCPSWGTPYFDVENNPTNNPALDRCSLSMVGCKKRFPIAQDTDAFPISINLKG